MAVATRRKAGCTQIRPLCAAFADDDGVFWCLWQDGGNRFAFVSEASANVDFDVRLIHNGASRGSGEKRPCVPSGAYRSPFP